MKYVLVILLVISAWDWVIYKMTLEGFMLRVANKYDYIPTNNELSEMMITAIKMHLKIK